MTDATSTATQTGREFVLTRVFDAPRELVFRAWTKREHLLPWWGPVGFTMLEGKLDARPGGGFHYSMKGPDGKVMWGKWVIHEVVPPEKLVFVNSFSDPEGNIVAPPFGDPWPSEIMNTVTFTEEGGKTTLSMRGVAINATEAERATFEAGFGSMQQGWGGSLDRLADQLDALRG
jgi:uncharacterized protein YndB with AHSA1/START domain